MLLEIVGMDDGVVVVEVMTEVVVGRYEMEVLAALEAPLATL